MECEKDCSEQWTQTPVQHRSDNGAFRAHHTGHMLVVDGLANLAYSRLHVQEAHAHERGPAQRRERRQRYRLSN